MLTALIMAGGKGSRFWPLSTEEKPKQFLNLIDEETMIQKTIKRIKHIIPIERIFVCTGQQYISLVKEQLPELPERNIIIEPEGRNTAPCITLSALIIKRYYNNATMVVLPSDHLIGKENKFREIIKAAEKFLIDNNGAILTLGMEPSRAETGYGYIKCGKKESKINEYDFIKVESFVEKPNKETAEHYLTSGSYLWNSGMFMWKVDNILEQIKEHIPTTYEVLHSIENVREDKLQSLININYKNTDVISIDYAVLEKSKDIYVVPSDIEWDDVGSWEALERYKLRDNKNNISMGQVKYLDSWNNIIISDSNTEVIINGLSNIYVIKNEGKLIIGLKENLSEVKELAALYK